jgi:hypothetical protein
VISLYVTRIKLVVLVVLAAVAAVTGGGFFDGGIVLP